MATEVVERYGHILDAKGKRVVPEDGIERLWKVAAATGHPTRMRVLVALRGVDSMSPIQLSGVLGVSLGTVSYHVRKLHKLKMLRLVKQKRRRGAVEHYYRLTVAGEKVAGDVVLAAAILEGRSNGA